MANYSAADVKKLREETGAGVMDCKQALEEASGDFAQAKELVRQRGLARAEKKADRETKEGYIACYVHGNKIGVLVELLCETDYVGRNDEFQALANEIARQVAAMSPESVDELLQQESIRHAGKTVDDMIKELSGKIGERFVLNRFVRYQVGE